MGNLNRVKILVLVARLFALLVLAVCAVYWLTGTITGTLSGDLLKGSVLVGITFLGIIPSTLLVLILGAPTYLVFERIKQMKHAVDVGDTERLKVLAAPEWAIAALLFSGVVPGVVFLIVRNLVQETEEAPPPSSVVVADRRPRPSRTHSPAPETVRTESGQVTSPVMHPFTLDRMGDQGWLSRVRQLAQNVSEIAVKRMPGVNRGVSAAPGRATLQDVVESRVQTEETWRCPNCAHQASAPVGKSNRYKCRRCGTPMSLLSLKNQ